jgi:DNA-binding response OmpR family regulator
MSEHLVLFVEDEPVLAEIVQESLQSRGYEVIQVGTVKEALNAYYAQRPDIIVLDVMLPDGDGFTVARQIRSVDIEVPVIFLTSKSLPQDVIEGFESGGNDYLKKPFSLEELIIRIKVLLNRNRLAVNLSPAAKTTALGDYQFQYPNGILTYMGKARTLTTRESEILQLLILNQNQLLDRNTILKKLWGDNDYFSGRSLDVFITKLRKYINADPSVSILNIRGQGYKLIY